MQILLSHNKKKRAADLWSLDRLLRILKETKGASIHDEHFEATREQWISYLDKSINSNFGKFHRRVLTLPFETDFLGFLKRIRKAKN